MMEDVHLRPVVLCLACVALALAWQADPIDKDDPANYDQPGATGVCQRTWRPILKLNQWGGPEKGSIDAVRAASLAGHMLRVKLKLQDGPYVVQVDNANVRGQHVCGESVWHVSDNGTHIDEDTSWRLFLVCTNGFTEVIESPYSRPPGWVRPAAGSKLEDRQKDAARNYGAISNTTVSMVWYVKEIGSGAPVYAHYLDGSRVSGSLEDLMTMAGLGETRVVMRDRGYSFSMNNVVVDKQTMEVNGQSLNHVGQTFHGTALSFREPPYHWFSSWTTSGRRDNSRWFLGTNQPRGHNNDFVALDWHVDTCWREVYAHDNYGSPTSGSLDELIFLISLGHKVRCQYDNVVLEASAIRIKDQTVIAQSIEEMARRGGNAEDRHFFNTQAMWQWSTVHTTGTVRTVTYRVQDMSLYRPVELQRSVRWLVDTRPWKRVFSTPPRSWGGNVNLLVEAVRRGANIRFNIQQDEEAGFFFTNADNVRVDEATGTVYAQCLRHVSDQRDASTKAEYQIQKKPFHWFLMLSSDGVMAMSAWHIKDRNLKYDEVAPEANITWFAAF